MALVSIDCAASGLSIEHCCEHCCAASGLILKKRSTLCKEVLLTLKQHIYL